MIALSAVGILVSALAVLLPSLPSIALRIAGFQPVGQSNSTVAGDDIPLIIESRRSNADSFHLDGNREYTLPTEVIPEFQIGLDETGAEIAQMFLGADDILALCQRYTNYCDDNGSPFRRGRAQVNGNELHIDGEAYINVLNRWQRVQLQLRVGADATIHFDSIALDGVRYSIPEHGLGGFLRDIQTRVNRALESMTVRRGDATYELASIGVSGDQLVVTFRGR